MKSALPRSAAGSPLSDKLVRYGVGAGALAAAASAPSHSARADVISYSGNGFTSNTIYFDLQHTTATSVSASPFAAAEFELYINIGTTSSAKPAIKGLLTGTGVDTSHSGNGSTVSSSDNFVAADTYTSTAPQDFSLGLELPANTGNASDHYYGYVHFTYNGTMNTAAALTLDDYAYNNTVNAPITIPEPKTAALLISGAVGVGILSARRRKAAGTAAT